MNNKNPTNPIILEIVGFSVSVICFSALHNLSLQTHLSQIFLLRGRYMGSGMDHGVSFAVQYAKHVVHRGDIPVKFMLLHTGAGSAG